MKNLRIKVCQIDSPAPVSFSGPVFCQVGFDDSTVQRTPNAHNAKKLCWNSTLNCKHSNINKSSELKVKLCYSKNKKTCELNAATVPLSNLQNMTFQTRYETLNIKGQVGCLVFVFGRNLSARGQDGCFAFFCFLAAQYNLFSRISADETIGFITRKTLIEFESALFYPDFLCYETDHILT